MLNDALRAKEMDFLEKHAQFVLGMSIYFDKQGERVHSEMYPQVSFETSEDFSAFFAESFRNEQLNVERAGIVHIE